MVPIENHTIIPELYLSKKGKVAVIMLGTIGGTSLLFSDLPRLEPRVVHNPFGNSEVLCGDIVLLLRHQNDRPPHRINFRSHLAALALSGVDRLVTIGSAGSLRREIAPGSLMIPSDYMRTSTIPSIHEHKIRHVHPGFTPALAAQLAGAIPEALTGGVYVQTRGPRIETRAEVRASYIVAIDPRYLRPAEVDTLLGDASKARAKLGWAPRVRFRELVAEMAQEDLREAERGRLAMKQVPSGGPRLR